MSILKKGVLATTLAASALVSTSPAMARDYYRQHDNTAAVAIGAGIVGLAIGAIAASSNDDRHDRYDRRYYDRDSGYYYDRSARYDGRDGWSRDGWGDRYRHDDRYGRDSYYARRGY